MGILGVFILNTTKEIKTVRAYIWALWLGDIGHVGFSLYVMGWEEIMNPLSFSATMWGNTGFTLFLFISRSLYLMGIFDEKPQASTGRELRPRKSKAKKK